MQNDVKLCRTPQLVEAATASQQEELNRLLPDELLEALDPDGVHVVQPMMVHEHAGGQEVEQHLRCRVYLKVSGTSDPVLTFADFRIADIDEMVTA